MQMNKSSNNWKKKNLLDIWIDIWELEREKGRETYNIHLLYKCVSAIGISCWFVCKYCALHSSTVLYSAPHRKLLPCGDGDFSEGKKKAKILAKTIRLKI